MGVSVKGLEVSRRDAMAAVRFMDIGQASALSDLADIFREGESDIFNTQGGAIGGVWKPLKPSTIKSRARLAKKFGLQIGATAPMLVNFGDLRWALTKKGGAHHQFVGRDVVRLGVEQRDINRHNRKKGLGLGRTAAGKRRRPRGKAAKAYPDNIVDIHDQGMGNAPKRAIIGTPPRRQAEMDRRVEKFLDDTARILEGGLP